LKSILLWPRTELLTAHPFVFLLAGEVASSGYDRTGDEITLDEVEKIAI
jgi:hypothetical protein